MEGSLVATARFIVDKAAILLQLDEKLKAMTNIEEKLENLKELSTIIDMVIEDVESHTLNKDTVKDWLRKLKYLAYDLEDVVECYDTEALRKQRSTDPLQPVSDFFSSNNQVVFRSWISDKINDVTNSLDSILPQKSFLNLPRSSSHMSLGPYGGTHSRNDVVIGRETEKNMIVDMLIDDDKSSHSTLKVIAIVGMGGLGKTTLAQLVFNDERVKTHFASSRMWKVVGAEFDSSKIMTAVLQLATHKPVKISEIDLVKQKLDKKLSGKRFLLVLDDVWNEDLLKWGVLKTALTCGARGSKILVTTRSLQVSSIMDSFNTHQIQQLSRDDCLFLFKKFAFGDKVVDPSLMEIGGKIVEKCGGVPFAAISLGNMLRDTRDETYWSSVLKSERWQLRDERKVLAVLKWSYDTLPLPSKKCFAFGSLFPKHDKMQKDELIKLWIANGFVRSNGNFDAETVGNRVFDDLVQRSFFLVDHFEGDPHVTECKMHDLMHDLARSMSENVHWNVEDSVEDIGNRTYHLNLRQCSAQISQSKILEDIGMLKPSYLRTLILSSCDLYKYANLLEVVLSKLKFLRVLDLSGNEIKEVPASIRNLIYLRYLNLSGNDIKVLPEFITLLHNLQFLDCDYLGLEHMPCGLSQLTNLRSLPVFIADNCSGACSITELEDLKLHGEMTIKFSENFTDYICSGRKILKNKHLNQLYLKCSRRLESNDKNMLDDLWPNTSLKKLSIQYYGSRQFPTWLMESQLPNLVEVRLEQCNVCKGIPSFGDMRFLKKLDLQIMDGITQMGAEFHGSRGFPSLQELILNDLCNLNEWSESHVDDELFPSLQKLKISNCPKLTCIPWLPKIQELNITGCNGSIFACVGRLTSLSILQVDNMNMTSLPNGCIRNLTSLTELQIIRCGQVQSLPGNEIQYLEMLRSLTINACLSIILQQEILVQILNSLREFKVEICGKNVNLRGQLQHLRTLKELFITGAHELDMNHSCIDLNNSTKLGICCCEELESLMTGQPASSVLEHLEICDISNLMILPDWLQHLKSLRQVSIKNCPQLGTLPRGLLPRGLKPQFSITNCPQLKQRYGRQTGDSQEPYVKFINPETKGRR